MVTRSSKTASMAAHKDHCWMNYSSFCRYFSFLWFFSLLSGRNVVTATTCGSETCYNNGDCLAGTPPAIHSRFSHLPASESTPVSDTEYCDCKENQNEGNTGYIGSTCEVAYEECEDGTTVCYNHGKCTPLFKEHFSGADFWGANAFNSTVIKFVCDCQYANKVSTERYAGQFCEISSVDECSNLDTNLDFLDGSWFCSNGGTCQDGDGGIDNFCNCESGFEGPHCEFTFEPSCDLSCENEGQCKLGVKDINHLKGHNPFLDRIGSAALHKNGMHCVCPEGYTGIRCEIEMEMCLDQQPCLHGSTCATMKDADGADIPYCDCRSADKIDDALHFSGKYCEYEFSTDNTMTGTNEYLRCDHPPGALPSEYYCLNMGACPENSDTAPFQCSCPSSHTGAHCEFLTTALMPTCNLDCKNNGICYHGATAQLSNEQVLEDLSHLLNPNDEGHINFMHCHCPIGFSGIKCEIQLTVCGTDNFVVNENYHVCANGGKCVQTDDEDSNYMCDCSDAIVEGDPYVGKYCEMESTQFCDPTKENDFTKTYDVNGGIWFCANDGQCVYNEDDINKKCNCISEYSGPHCEYEALDFESFDMCDLDCLNGGQCNYGIKNIAEFNGHDPISNSFTGGELHVAGRHCVCPEGFTGLFCENSVSMCGDKPCLHGATCLTDEISDGITIHFCDCDSIDTNEKDDSYFRGPYCETQMFHNKQSNNLIDGISCDYPLGADPNEYYCLNGGQCPSDYHKECTCTNKYTGPVCEYPVETDGPTFRECDLECQNGGTCFFGTTDHGAAGEFSEDLLFLDTKGHEQFMYCKCPDGYTGLQCETLLEICGTDKVEHACAHGSTCVDVGDGTYECDCAMAGSGGMARFDGLFCEHEATSFCGDNPDAFCTNNGKCKEIVEKDEEHAGCECNEGYFGERCEYTKSTALKATSQKKSRSNKAFVAVIVVLSIVVILPAIVYLLMKAHKERSRRKEFKESDTADGFSSNMSIDGTLKETLERDLGLTSQTSPEKEEHLPEMKEKLEKDLELL